jgi:hypothetical protein
MGSMDFSMTGGTLPADLVDSLKTADVTNIAARVETLSIRMFDDKTPPVISKIQNGIQQGSDAEYPNEMKQLKDSISVAFQQAKQDYLRKLDTMKPEIESTFQAVLNTGFKGMYITVSIAAFIAAFVLAFYHSRKKAEP